MSNTRNDLRDAIFAFLEEKELRPELRDQPGGRSYEEFVDYVEVAVRRVEQVSRSMNIMTGTS